jgi:hypothetical protein
MILQMRLFPLHNGLFIPMTSHLLWLQVPLSQSPVLFKQCQEMVYQREFHPKQKRIWILLQRELLMRAWSNLINLLLLLTLIILSTVVSLPQDDQDIMLVVIGKDLQRFDVCQLTVNNMTLPFQPSVIGTNLYQCLPIVPTFKPSTIGNNVSISLFLRNVTCSKTVVPMILNAFIKFIPTLS